MTSRSTAPPVSLTEDALASVFDARIVTAWWGPFAKRLGQVLVDRIPPKGRVLELGCASGKLTLALQALVPEGRVMAIEPRKHLLDLARTRAGDLTGRRIFFKSEPIEQAGFAEAAFDAVVANLPFEHAEDPAAVLDEMRRTGMPGATVALTVALEGTWSVVHDLYGDVLEKFDFPGATERLATLRASYPEALDARARLEGAGLREVTCETWTFELRFRNARELFRDPVVASGPVARWRAVAGDDSAWERAAFHLRDSMDTYFGHADVIDVPVHAAVLVGRVP